jgi:competence protein ComEC
LGLVMPALLARPWMSLVLALVMVLGFVRVPAQPGWPPKGWVLVVCEVGQGDGLVVHVAPGQAIVIDAGPDPVSMQRCLDQLRVTRVPLLILSHFHADHVDGLAGVFADRTVGQLWVSPFASPAGEAAAVRAEAERRGVGVAVPVVGDTGRLGEASWQVLGPVGEHGTATGAEGSAGEDAESAEENDASLVLMITVRGVRILVTGDVEPPGQQAIVADGADLRADVLKLPHHGSGRQDPGFVAATGARVAIASAGVDNDYGHPAPRTVQLVESLGMKLLRTDEDGSVAITSRNGTLGAVTQRGR